MVRYNENSECIRCSFSTCLFQNLIHALANSINSEDERWKGLAHEHTHTHTHKDKCYTEIVYDSKKDELYY
jgi:hypothetical protein